MDVSKEVIFSKNGLATDMVSLILCIVLGVIMGVYLAPMSRDFENYTEYYNSLTALYESAGSRFEFGFDILAKSLTKVAPNYSSALYIFLIPLSLFLKCFILRKLSVNGYLNVLLIFFAYVLSFSILLELNQLRAAVAISFGYLSLHLVSSKSYWLAFFAVFIAFSMHYSSVIFFMGWMSIILVYKNKVKLLFILITAFCVISKSIIIIVETLNPIAAEYSKNYDEVNFGFTSVTLILAVLYFLYHFYNIKRESKMSASLIMFLYAGIMFSIVMSSIPVYATRILELTEVGIIFISVNKKYTDLYSYGSGLLAFIVIFHKFVAYLFVNPLLNY